MSQSLEVTWHVRTRITEDGSVYSSFFRTSLPNHCVYWEWWRGHVGMMDESYFGPEEFPKHRVPSQKKKHNIQVATENGFTSLVDSIWFLKSYWTKKRWQQDESMNLMYSYLTFIGSGGPSHFSVERWSRGEQLSGVGWLLQVTNTK